MVMSQKRMIANIDLLPNEILYKLLSYLSIQDLNNCADVCSKWNDMVALRRPQICGAILTAGGLLMETMNAEVIAQNIDGRLLPSLPYEIQNNSLILTSDNKVKS